MTEAKAYRRKVTYTTAEQFLIDGPPVKGVLVDTDCNAYVITAHEQRAYLADGDWVIPEGNAADRFYPCKPDVFEKTYELVPAATEGEPIAADAPHGVDDFDDAMQDRYFGYNVRKDALAFAIGTLGGSTPTKGVVDRAQDFADFLNGAASNVAADPVMPELKPTLKMQDGTEPPPHVARMLIEYEELGDRRKKLETFIDTSPVFAEELCDHECRAMRDQLEAMNDYYAALMRRLAYAGAMTS